MPPHRTRLIDTPSGLMATLNIASVLGCLDSLWAACDQYQQRCGRLPDYVWIAETLPESWQDMLTGWLAGRNIRCALHRGETAWLLIPPADNEEAIR